MGKSIKGFIFVSLLVIIMATMIGCGGGERCLVGIWKLDLCYQIWVFFEDGTTAL